MAKKSSRTSTKTKLSTKTAILISVAILGLGGLSYAAAKATTSQYKIKIFLFNGPSEAGSIKNVGDELYARCNVTDKAGKQVKSFACKWKISVPSGFKISETTTTNDKLTNKGQYRFKLISATKTSGSAKLTATGIDGTNGKTLVSTTLSIPISVKKGSTTTPKATYKLKVMSSSKEITTGTKLTANKTTGKVPLKATVYDSKNKSVSGLTYKWFLVNKDSSVTITPTGQTTNIVLKNVPYNTKSINVKVKVIINKNNVNLLEETKDMVITIPSGAKYLTEEELPSPKSGAGSGLINIKGPDDPLPI